MRAELPILAKEADRFPENLFDLVDSGESGDWHLLYTRSRREKDLMRRLLALKVPFYGPCAMKKSRSPSGRVRTSWMPLFSNYVFLFGGHDEVLSAQQTNCLSQVATVTEKAVLTADLRALQSLIATEAPVQVEEKLQPGELVRVRSGPFKGCEGVVAERRGRSHLIVNVGFVQRSVLVELDDFSVEPLGTSASGQRAELKA